MYIVIDINTLSMVFNEGDARHLDFCFVKTWIEKGCGVLVYGGTKYTKELSNAYRYLRLLRNMRDAGKAIKINDTLVDAQEASICEKTVNTDCDDQHIIALLVVTRCTLLCSNDSRSFPFIKDKKLYPKGYRAVKIYTKAQHKSLLIKAYLNSSRKNTS